MLIECDRHRPKDLELWEELETADKRCFPTPQQLDRTKEAIERFAEQGPCWCGVSWGKDSVVVAWLVAEHNRLHAERSIPLVHIRTFRSHPYCDQVHAAFVRRVEETRQAVAIWRIDEPHADAWPHWGTGIEFARRQFGDRAIHGVRSAESSTRALSAAVHGVVTDRMCRPILRWSTAAVFGYLAVVGLPVHPNYAMLGGGRWDRDRIRVGSIGGERGRGIGRDEWEQEYYGDVLRRIEVRLSACNDRGSLGGDG